MHLLMIVFSCILLLFHNSITGHGHEIIFSLEDCHGIFASNWGECSSALIKEIFGWHTWTAAKQDERCGFPCVSQVKGRLTNFQWKWDGRYKCESKAPGIVGVSTRFSKKGAIEWAVSDFLKKAVAGGHIRREDTNCEIKKD